jgi:3'-phosphoadenosine 5'-phosphosulfate sulfotransferase (PAPS reductase)/FAD synthetase
MSKRVRHVLGVSGGRDSAALAIFMRGKVPEMEYFFCDTQKELPETYDFLERLEVFLGKPILRLNASRGFDHWLYRYGGYLPSQRMRWCTRQLKLKPLEDFIGEDAAISYVAIRADEDRDGNLTAKPNIRPQYPFVKAGVRLPDVIQILEESGLGLPEYYSWRTRSGCYFCFFQRKSEWVGLKEHHPELFEKAKAYEKVERGSGLGFTWNQSESLIELENPDRIAKIKADLDRRKRDLEKRISERKVRPQSGRLANIFKEISVDPTQEERNPFIILEEALEEEDESSPCLICHK